MRKKSLKLRAMSQIAHMSWTFLNRCVKRGAAVCASHHLT